MTAPAVALDALCGSPACHGQRCPRLRHRHEGGEQRGRCSVHRACRAFEFDELAALDGPAGLDGSPDRPRGDLPGTDPAPHPVGAVAADPPDGGQPAAEVDGPASAAGPDDTLAGWLAHFGLPANGTVGTVVEHVRANALLAGAFQAMAEPAGQLLHQGRTWWCPRCLQGRELPSARCCRTRLIPADVIVRRRPTDG